MAGTYVGGYHGTGDFGFSGTNQNAQLKARGAANVAAGRRLSESEHRRLEAEGSKSPDQKQKVRRPKTAKSGVVRGQGVSPSREVVTAGVGRRVVSVVPTQGPGVDGVSGPGGVSGVVPVVRTSGPGVAVVGYPDDVGRTGVVVPRKDASAVPQVVMGGTKWLSDPGYSSSQDWEDVYGDSEVSTTSFFLMKLGADFAYNIRRPVGQGTTDMLDFQTKAGRAGAEKSQDGPNPFTDGTITWFNGPDQQNGW